MSVLQVQGLRKNYPAFTLKDVSFALEEGKITGFIGRNGAGKSTTLKALMNLVHPDGGEVIFFGKSFHQAEFEIKQQVGFVLGGVDYYPNKKIKTITAVTKSFYAGWDDAAYARYTTLFQLDENKTPAQLSAGMRVKYALALALSHKARLLVLDEPTSGLDPVSRDDLLDVFMALAGEGITILFSTHITSDLDKCADHILYIKNGAILAQQSLPGFVQSYRVVDFATEAETAPYAPLLVGMRRSKNGVSALMRTGDLEKTPLKGAPADLEAIMVHIEKEAG